ncbi:MAG: hypothetical protein GY792_11080 [Gammaproteobacteria bacterium]|nr:hypothetical protein [Gammaproteobacteria bacterium]
MTQVAFVTASEMQSDSERFARAAFAAADQNGDGFIDEAEFVHDMISLMRRSI